MKGGERQVTDLADCTYRRTEPGTGCCGLSKPDVDDAPTKTKPDQNSPHSPSPQRPSWPSPSDPHRRFRPDQGSQPHQAFWAVRMSSPSSRRFASVGHLYRLTGFEQGLNRVSAPLSSMDRRNSCPLSRRRERDMTGR